MVPQPPGLIIAARIAGTLFLSFARDGVALPVRNTGGLQIMQGPNRQCGHEGSSWLPSNTGESPPG